MPNTRGGKLLNREVAEKIHFFNENKSKELFTSTLNLYSCYDDRPKCIYCGTDIYYDNIVLSGDFCDEPKIYSGTSFLTTKKINGKEYHLCVCEDCMRKKFPEWDTKNKSRIFNMPHSYTQYAFNIPQDEIDMKKKELCVRSLESFIKKYGDEEGTKRWNSYIEKEKVSNTFEYKHEKYGMNREEFDEYNKSRSVTLENLIKRHGEIEGLKLWDEYCEKQRYTTSRDYFIEKYGEVDGIKKWMNFDKNRLNLKPYSTESQKVFNVLSSSDEFIGHEIYYATKNTEYQICTQSNNVYYLDYYDKTIGVCVEYNGTKFHPDPNKYKSDDEFSNPFMSNPVKCQVLWDKEKTRIDELKNEFDIKTIIIWDYDYKNFDDYKIKRLINTIIENGKEI